MDAVGVVFEIEPIDTKVVSELCFIKMDVFLSSSPSFNLDLFKCLRRAIRTSSVKVSMYLWNKGHFFTHLVKLVKVP